MTLDPTDEGKVTLKSMRNYGSKCEISLDQKQISQMIMMKNIWKSNLGSKVIEINGISLNQMSAIGVMICFMCMNLGDIAILNIHGVDNACIINRIGKSEAMALLNPNEKCGTL